MGFTRGVHGHGVLFVTAEWGGGGGSAAVWFDDSL